MVKLIRILPILLISSLSFADNQLSGTWCLEKQAPCSSKIKFENNGTFIHTTCISTNGNFSGLWKAFNGELRVIHSPLTLDQDLTDIIYTYKINEDQLTIAKSIYTKCN